MLPNVNINSNELVSILEPLIRRIIREEFSELIKNSSNTFYLQPDTQLYQDMQDIALRNTARKLNWSSHTEVWGE
jgi:hypothetical protein